MQDQRKPNILFMLSDDHAVQAISACGSRVNRTPNLDRIAAEGAVFRESFCTNSVCTPSRATILTGKHSYQNGTLTLAHTFDNSQTSFPKLLQEAGYDTAVVGKWHLNCDPTGFDYWQVLPGQGKYYNPDFLTANGQIRVEGYSADIIADRTMEWIENREKASRPFLACCHFKAPHRPWVPHPRYFDLYANEDIPAPGNLFDNYRNRCQVVRQSEMEIARHMYWDYDLKVLDAGPNQDRLPTMHGLFELDRMTPEQAKTYTEWNDARNADIATRRLSHEEFVHWVYQRYMKDYLRCIAAIDDNVGRMLDFLDESGLAENTIVVYCSDQGFYLGEHGWFDKRWMFEESFRMPLLIRWPGRIAPGTAYDQLVQNIDYAPTFLEAAGCDIPVDMHGTPLQRVIDEGQEIHDDLYYHYYQHLGEHAVPRHDGVRTQRYKLVHFYTVPEFNLFDLERDPSEMRSVHDDPAYAEILAEMQQRYWRAREKFGVPDEYGPESP